MLLQLAKRRMDPQSAEYRAYCRYLVPRLGRWITNMPEALDYMTASILEYPDKKECKRLLESVGFTDVYYRCLTLDVVCIHVGTRAGAQRRNKLKAGIG